MKKTLSRFLPLFAALIAAAAALFLFRAALAPGHTLLSPDSQIYMFAHWRHDALHQLLGGRYEVPTFDTPLCWLFPLNVASTVSYAFATALLAFGTALYLRHWKCPPAAALLGALALAFSGYHFTLFSAGHRGYFIMMVYAIFLLSAIDGMVETGRWPYFVFAAVCAVSALRGQPDIFAIWCGVLALYALLRLVFRIRATTRAARLRMAARWAAGVAVGVATLLLFGYPTIRYTLTDVVAGREAQIADSARNSKTADDSEEPTDDSARWDFATSWSLPPAELPELVCANLCGYDSGNAKGPYWGSIGRDVHYAETKQGFFNFRQHTIYLGAIPLLFALFGALSLLPNRTRKVPPSQRGDAPQRQGEVPHSAESPPLPEPHPADTRLVIAFWSIVALGSLILALGRYTPAYRLFYSLPMMSGIRGPMKFLHFTEVSVAMLAGFGSAKMLQNGGRRSALAAGLAGIVALLLLLAATLRDPAGLNDALVAMGATGNNTDTLRTILLGIRAQTLMLTALFFGLGAVALLFRASGRACPSWVAWVLVAAALCDSMRAASPYVNPVNARLLTLSNSLVESLRKTGQLEGSSWAGQAGGLENYRPFAETFNRHMPCADPRPGQGREDFAIQAAMHFRTEDTFRRWQLLGTRLVIAPMEEYSAMPQDSRQFTKLGTYAFTRNGVVSAPAGQAQFGALVLRNWIPNGSAYSSWESAENDEAAWAVLANPGLDLSRRLVVTGKAPECSRATGLIQPAVKAETVVGEADGNYRKVVFATADDSPEGLLLVRNTFLGFREVEALVDGVSEEILRADVLYRAVHVPSGRHMVEFRIVLHWWIAAAYGATALLLIAAAVALFRRPSNTPSSCA